MTVRIDVLGCAVQLSDQQSADLLEQRLAALEAQAKKVPDLLTRLDSVQRDHERLRVVLCRVDSATSQAREILDEVGGAR